MRSKIEKLRYLIYLILFCFSALNLSAGQAELEVLFAQLRKTESPEQRIDLKCKISQNYTEIGNFRMAEKVGQEALDSAISIEYKLGIARSYYSIARSKQYKGDFNTALSYHYLSIPYYENADAREDLAWTYLNIGISHQLQDSYKKSLRSMRKALAIFEDIKDDKGVAYTLINIGYSLNKLGYRDSLIIHTTKAQNILRAIEDDRGYTYTLFNFAEIYEADGNFKAAIQQYEEVIEILSDDKDIDGKATCLSEIAKLYFKSGDYEKAMDYANRSEALAIRFPSYLILREVYLTKSRIDSVHGNLVSSLANYKKYARLDHKLSAEENKQKASDMLFRFEKEQQALELKNAKQREKIKEKEKSFLKIVLFAAFIVLVIVVVFAIQLRKRANLLKRQRRIIQMQKEAADLQHKSIRDSITYAQRIQDALITSEEYITQYFRKEFTVYFSPKDIVSGDFYWAVQHEDAFYMITADCTGHGVPGAFMSLLNITILNNLIVEKSIESPAELLNHQRKEIVEVLTNKGKSDSQDGMDCVLCKFDLENQVLTFSAANSSLWLLRDGKMIRFKGDKMPVGMFLDMDRPFTEETISLQKGDVIYTFSDGIVDQFGGPNDKKFKASRLEKLLLDTQELSLEHQKQKIIEAIETWKGSETQTDDILFIAVRI